MRPSTLSMLLLSSVTAASKTSAADSNSYDAVVCGEDGFANGHGYSYSANAWNSEKNGFQCMSIINSTSSSPGFDATWKWPGNADAVHSYPHVTFPSNDQLPAPLSNISALRLAASWAMGPGSSAVPKLRLDTSGLGDLGAKANVAFDMFLDVKPDKSQKATEANYEVMVWIGTIGQPYPLGFDAANASCFTQQLGSVNFTLYTGQNGRGTNVFTWVSPTDAMMFDEDISPLLQYLWRNELVSADARLGIIEFGSEAYHSGNNVTFSAADFAMQVWLGTPPRYDLTPMSDDCTMPGSGSDPDAPGSDDPDSAGVRLLPAGVLFFLFNDGLGLGGSSLGLTAAFVLVHAFLF